MTDFKYLSSKKASAASDFEIPYTTCVTILFCGCTSWVLSQDIESKINSFATFCYRIMNVKREDRVSNHHIYHDQRRASYPLCKKSDSEASLVIFFVSQRKNLLEDMLSTYHFMAKRDLDAPLILPTSNVC